MGQAMSIDIKKMQAAAIALRDNNCEENYIEHINQSCPVNVLMLIDAFDLVTQQRNSYYLELEEYRRKYQREHIDTNRWKNRAELADAQLATKKKTGLIATLLRMNDKCKDKFEDGM
jgi:hypothetical protein